MNSSEIRQSYLDFFASKGHTIVPSASLMPGSPNLLFTNAGMNQFVPYFLAERPAPYNRAADTQKCIRAGGKHNDLEDVGFDTYHHTFFEMLGNWSFGNYFKKEAIEWAWELITEIWKFPKNRLYATVYQPGPKDPSEFDHEAYGHWESLFVKAGLDPKVHIRTGGKKDNFWMMGDTGPCGPCSEIHVDLTPNGDTKGSLVNASSPYCLEIWNLVFIQFNAEPDGSFKPLSAKHVDTGMGLERVAGIYATTNGFKDFSKPPSNYNSDLFGDIFAHITRMCGKPYTATMPQDVNALSPQEMSDAAFRVLADHIRTLSFAIADGILPGNEGRNYVLRRILRRAILWGKRIGLPAGFFTELVDPLVNKMGPVFPELIAQRDVIKKVVGNEERTFDRTLDRGLQLFDKIAADKGKIPGTDAFVLYDTYGFPIDLTQLIARERKLDVDIDGFNAEMEKQRERARASQQKTIISVADTTGNQAATIFTGYDNANLESFETELVATETNTQGDAFLVFSQSPFYAELGGQVGDTGIASVNGQTYVIVNTLKDAAGRHLHQVKAEGVALPAAPAKAVVSVDGDRRRAIQRHHTATHVLHWALRKVLGTHVRQAGSLVTPDRLRFDFAHFEAATPEQLREIETLANRRILENHGVRWYEVPFAEKPEGCLAFFGEKYGAVVRVVDVGGWSMELCGGTHVTATGEIGLLKVVAETAIAAGTRRIEAVAGESAIDLMQQQSRQLQQLAQRMSCQPAELEARMAALLDQRSVLEKQLRSLQQKGAAAQADELAAKALKDANGLNWVVAQVQAGNPNDLRDMAAQLGKKIGAGVVVLGAAIDDKASVVALCTAEAVAAGHQAGKLVGTLCGQLGGKGGGKPDFAMGGGKDTAKIGSVLEAFRATVK